MMARRGVMTLLAGGAAALLSGCNPFGNRYNYRYKITVEVNTPEGVKTGFAVHETLISKSNVDLGDISQKQNSETRGEAVVVDLLSGQTLFVLMPGEVSVINALDNAGTGGWDEKAIRIAQGSTPKGPQILPFSAPQNYNKSKEFPLFVKFEDVNDPKTAELVQPDNLSPSFGDGVKLKRVTVQVTDEDVTVGIGKRLGWLVTTGDANLKNHPGAVFLPDNPSLAETLSHSDFRRGPSQ
jgi:hypothetical protein